MDIQVAIFKLASLLMQIWKHKLRLVVKSRPVPVPLMQNANSKYQNVSLFW